MTEIRFYHLEQRRVDQALPPLLERALEEDRRVLVRASSEEMVAALNERLWTYDDASFLPHGAAGDGDPMEQPIFLTSELENPNAATMLVRLSGAEAGEADDDRPPYEQRFSVSEDGQRLVEVVVFKGGRSNGFLASREWDRAPAASAPAPAASTVTPPAAGVPAGGATPRQ